MQRPVFLLTLVVLSMSAASLFAAQVSADRSEKGVTIKIDGQPFTEYLVRSGAKPIVWPILGPTGKPMTRAYPMGKGDNETKDHIHQRSLWFTHGCVNGIDFWAETPPGKCGTIEHREFIKVQGGPEAVVATRNDWLSPDGKKICEDQRTLTFGTDGNSRWIDFDVTLKATAGPVTFTDTKEGSFGVRVAETIRVDIKKPGGKKGEPKKAEAKPEAAKQGGRIVNSHGQVNTEAWGKPADWVDYYGPVDGQTVGIAILNHPCSYHYPTGWHVRTYGLFAANPFASRSFADKNYSVKSNPAVACTLAAGETLRLRYRVILHRGDEKEGKIAEAFAAYAKQ